MRVRCVIIEWKADDSPISFETSLFTVFYYIKPNQLSQRQHAIIEAGWAFLNRIGWLHESKHAVCDYSDEGIEIL